jgi:hypothetical protein
MSLIRATLSSQPSTDEGTFGTVRLAELGGAWCSIELPWRDNVHQYSCIPRGATFHFELRPTSKWSPRNGVDLEADDHLLYQGLDIPGRSFIEIHAATWAGDVRKGWHSDLLGCIALGRKVGSLAPPELGRPQACILESRIALTEFMRATGGAPLELTIAEA